MARSKKKKSGASLDFAGVESRGRVAPGEYRVKVVSVTQDSGQGEHDYWRWEFKVLEGKRKGTVVSVITSLSPKALWKIKGMLEALGVEVPDGPMDIDFDDMVDRTMIGIWGMRKGGDGEDRVDLIDQYPDDEDPEEDGDDKSKRGAKKDDDDEDEKPARRRRGKKDDDEEEGEKPRSRRGKKDDDEEEDEKSARRRRGAKAEDDEEEEPRGKSRRSKKDDDEDDGKESKRGSKKSKKKKPDVDADDVKSMGESELEELIDEHDIDVDLDDYKTLKKKQAAVIAALELDE